MHDDLVPRRTQFSSCDACRKSRVACDAMRGRPADAGCTRCAMRNRRCTFEWMKRVGTDANRRTASLARRDHFSSPGPAVNVDLIRGRQSSTSSSSVERTEEPVAEDDWQATSAPSTPPPALSADVADWLRGMYEDVFEAVFGSWLGNYSCPFVFGENGSGKHGPLALSVSISSLCSQFDQWMKAVEVQGARLVGQQDQIQSLTELEKDQQIDRSLSRATQTFSARWLPLTFQSPSLKEEQTQLVERLWREVRSDLLKVINRPCYRSALTLFIFALTPIPAGISEEEEGNGIPAQFCVQAALQQVQQLRARQRSLEFNGSKVSPLPDVAAIASSPDQITTDFMGLESVIYWAALTFDTSSSLTLNTKSLLSSGLLGWEFESSWRLVKTCTNMFHEETEDWRLNGLHVTEENANRIIAAAAAWKLLGWKMAAVFKEALREGQEEEAVHRVYTGTIDAMDQFNMTYRGLLVACERRIQFLCQHTKLRWYELMLHYHLSILIIIDAIETAGRTDLLGQMSIARSDAEGTVMNCLLFGISNSFSIPKLGAEVPDTFVTVPLVAIDPYPHHVVAAVQLLWKAMDRDYETGNLDRGTLRNFQSVLLQTLGLLPQTSKSVRDAKEQAQLSSANRGYSP